MVAKKKPVAAREATSVEDDERIEEIREISDKEVLVIRSDGRVFRCHPNDVTAGLDEQDDPSIAPAGTKG